MDQFAAIRRLAHTLRMAAGIDDSRAALDAVKEAAKSLKLIIRPLQPSHVELEGAHGLLDRQFMSILVRNDLQDDALAEVIAHEIGHFEVHDGPERGYYPRAEVNGGDPNQRIETYGIKERREAQANAFGRELILPRPLARRLFMGGKTASDISRDLRVPYETTLQQLADGVLLPDVAPIEKDTENSDATYDDSQNRAAMHRGKPFLLRAGPGTGKTKTLTARIVSLINDGVLPSSILALTFSNRAALELSERIQKAVGPKAVNVWTGTFHAFGLDTIRKHHVLFDLPSDPRVVDASEAVAMLEDVLPALDLQYFLNLLEPALALRDILKAIARAKDELWSWEAYRRAALEMKASAQTDEQMLAAQKAFEVSLVYEHYQKQLISDRAVDYGDLIMRPTTMMRQDRDFRMSMRAKFTYVHIDEYQDVNRASAMMVREIVGEGENLWVVGDARQSIYRFRGASAANIAKFQSDYQKGTRDGLEVNYRSTKEIVDLYARFGDGMKVKNFAGKADLVAKRGGGGERVTIFEGANVTDEMDVVARSIRDLESAGIPLRRQTVLARSNGSLARIAEELGARGVPVLYLGPLFDRSEVRDLLSILSLITDKYGTGLVRVAGLPQYRVPIEDILKVIDAANAAEARVFRLLRKLETVDGLSAAGRAGLLLVSRHLQELSEGTTPWLALSKFLFDQSDYIRTVLSGQSPSDDLRRVAVRQLLDALRNMPLHRDGPPIRRALDRIRHMILLADERDLRHLPPELDGLEGVRLMTIHASKGLEFDAVHLPGLYVGAVPAPNRPPACPPPRGMIETEDADAHEAEEESVFFVAMSRAKSYLRLYYPLSRNGRRANPSRLLDELPLVRAPKLAGIARATPPHAYSPILSPPAPKELTASDIERYTKCPRRFFYESVLRLSRRSKSGAYLDAHTCLQKVLTYLRELPPGTAYDRMEAETVFEQAWMRSELEKHVYGHAYRRLTRTMLDRLHISGSGAASNSGELFTKIGGETIKQTADRVIREGGTTIVRMIRSGRQSTQDVDRLSAAMLLKAVKEAFGQSVRLENHYLLTGAVLPIDQTKAKYDKRISDSAAAISDIRHGRYQPEPNDFSCPRCPYIFICGAPEALNEAGSG